MVRTSLFFLALLFTLQNARSAPLPVVPLGITSAAQDASGTVYAMGSDPMTVWIWRQNRWAEQHFSQRDAQPVGLVRGPDGAVWGVWHNSDDGQTLLSRHQKGRSQVVASVVLPDSNWMEEPFCDSRGRLWLVGQSDKIVALDTKGHVVAHTTIQKAQWQPQNAKSDSINVPDIAEDGRGRLWFYQSAQSDTYPRSLRGALMFDEAWHWYPTLAGLPDKPFTVLASAGKNALWAAQKDAGLFRFDLTTQKALPVAAPKAAKEDLGELQSIFVLGDATFFSSTRMGDCVWRLQNGQWKQIPHFDIWNNSTRFPLLARNGDLWVGSAINGLWHITAPLDEAKTENFSWEQGFSLVTTRWIFPLPGDEILCVGSGDGAVQVRLAALRGQKPSPRAQMFPNDLTIETDARGHVWTFWADYTASILREWDGKTWRIHRVPGPTDDFDVFGVDSKGRVWLCYFKPQVTKAGEKPAWSYVFSPQSGAWSHFSDFQSAAFSFRDQGLLTMRGGYDHMNRLQINSRGQIALGEGETLRFFDGQKWRGWTQEQLASEVHWKLKNTNYYDGGWIRGPSFNAQNELTTNLDKQIFAWNGQHWRRVSDWEGPVSVRSPDLTKDERAKLEQFPLLGVPGPGVYSPMTGDNTGARWYAYNGQLWKIWRDRVAPQFERHENQPFLDGREIHTVMTRDNWAILGVWPHNGGWSQTVTVTFSTPETHATLKTLAPNSWEITPTVPKNGGYGWRLDGKDWRWRDDAKPLRLEALPPGRHEVEIAVFDARLNSDPTPMKFDLEVSQNREEWLESTLQKLLHGVGEERDAAVIALARAPEIARPALQKARETADDDQKWWIDATLQKMAAP